MEAADSSPPAEVSRVAVRLPPFWAERPAVWFAQAEAQFFLAGVNIEKTKLFHIISQLDHRYAAKVKDKITSPPEREAEIVRQLSPSREQRIRQLLTLEEMGDRKRFQFLRHFRGLAPDVPEDFHYTIWSSRLPPNIQTILASQQECSLDAAARCADRISEVAPQLALASVGPLSTTLHFCRRSRTSPVRWRHSGPSRTTSTPASGTLHSAPGTLVPAPEISAPAPGIAD
jgi:hypothetical protein